MLILQRLVECARVILRAMNASFYIHAHLLVEAAASLLRPSKLLLIQFLGDLKVKDSCELQDTPNLLVVL